MKAIRRIAVLLAGILLISSCSILKSLTGNATTSRMLLNMAHAGTCTVSPR